MKSRLAFIKGDKVGSETDYRDNLPVNMYAVLRNQYDVPGYMMQAQGLTQYATGSGIDRGANWNDRFQTHYRVSGTDLIEVATDGTVTVLGTIPGTDTVSMPYSFNTQAIIASGRYFLYDPTNGFREVTDSDLGDPIDAVWTNNRYFFTDGENIYHTDVGDEESISPLKFATAEFMPDPDKGVAKTPDNKVMVFGRYSIEYFVDRAAENFAYTRVESRAVKAGIVGTHCKVEIEDAFYIMGGRKNEAVSIHRVGVGSAEKLATREVDKLIGQYNETELADSVLETYEEDGTMFLIVHLPNEVLQLNVTLAKKASIEQAWSILATGTDQSAWRAKHGVFEASRGSWAYGDKQSASVAVLDALVATQYGEIAEWLLYTPLVIIEGQSIDEFEVETIPGFTVSGDAKVFLSLTYDGFTYGKEWIESYGAPLEYGKRFIVRRLGYVPDWVGVKLRGATTSRMAFARATIDHG